MKFYLAAFIWLGCILFLQYIPDQGDFALILPCLLGSFASYIWLGSKSSDVAWTKIVLLAVLARILIIPAFPNLSDDIYRFVWDGYLWTQGIHPFSVLPSEVVDDNTFLNAALFDQLNSKEYYSIYPPIAQLVFYVSTLFGYEDIMTTAVAMKAIHSVVDILTLFLMIRLLDQFQLPRKNIAWYALNPLIIIELVGNLHHEGIVIAFMTLTLLALKTNRPILGGGALAGAIATKILPILFFPLLFFWINKQDRLKFCLASTLATVLLFALLIQDWQITEHLLQSANLYFQKFEFNASIYYLIRMVGYWFYGYNIIGTLGPVLSISALILIGLIALFAWYKSISSSTIFIMLIWTYCSYGFLSATLHPWYLAILVFCSVFTRYKFPVLWSGLIMLTYINYSFPIYQEQMWLVFIEYSLVIAVMYVEIKKYGWIDSKVQKPF